MNTEIYKISENMNNCRGFVDLRELWARIVFNFLASNRDEHLRNYEFILVADGWRRAPA